MTRCKQKDPATRQRYGQILKETMLQLGMTRVPKQIRGRRKPGMPGRPKYSHVVRNENLRCALCKCDEYEPIRANPDLCLCSHPRDRHLIKNSSEVLLIMNSR